MNFTLDAKDIFLWADGYWCYREDFHQQLRQTYGYLLVRKDSHQWQALTGAVAFTRRPESQGHGIQRSQRT